MDTKIKASFWDDPTVADLDAEARLALLWLMTARINDAGWVDANPKLFRFHTDLAPEALARACEALQKGIVCHAKGIWMRHYIRHQIGTGPKLAANLMARAIVKALPAMPPEIVSQVLIQYPELKGVPGCMASPSQGLAKSLPRTGEREGEREGEGEGERVLEESAERNLFDPPPPAVDPKPAKPPGITWSPDHGWQGITGLDHAAWADAYPACKIDRQLAQMGDWLRSNPLKAHKSNWRRFLTNWLKGEQDRGGDLRGGPSLAVPGSQGPADPQKKEGAAAPAFPWRKVASENLGWNPDPAVAWAGQPPSVRRELREAWKKISPALQQSLTALAQPEDYL